MQIFQMDLSMHQTAQTLNAKQGDVGRKIRVVITDGGENYRIPAGAQFSVWYSGPGGEGNYSAIGNRSAFAVEDNAVTVELVAQMLAEAGTGMLCLVMNSADGSQLGLWNMVYAVEPVPGAESQGAQQYYTALTELASQAIRAAETFQTDSSLSVAGKAADAKAVATALAGRAPSGYGLGEVKAKYVASPDDITGSGFYRSVAPGVTSGTAWYLCISYSDNAKTVLGFNEMSGGLAFMRTMKNGVWGQWDWVNPPMELGVEYRTTERHNGKAVYTKMLETGELTNGGSASLGAYATTNIVRATVRNGRYLSPYCTADGFGNQWSIWHDIYDNKIVAHFGSGHASINFTVQIWYTKD